VKVPPLRRLPSAYILAAHPSEHHRIVLPKLVQYLRERAMIFRGKSFFVCGVLCLLLLSVCGPSLIGQVAPATSPSASSAVDPNRESSEFNHHVAGWALIGVGLLVLAGFAIPQLRSFRFVWPALFILAGLFLAFWSDAEMWPRGNLNWLWLLHHDAEARQHKIYALLLVAMGVVEYLRARGSLPRFWRTWAFPILAVIGAGMLLIHDHSHGSGVHSPEVKAYLVNPALNVNGEARPLEVAEAMPMNHDMAGMADMPGMEMDHATMASDMDHTAMASPASGSAEASPHHHHMSPAMLLIEREHFWFMIVGLGIALFKFLADAEFLPARISAFVWPSGMVLLGILLVLYHE
jgi:hypothetical protein